MKTRIDQAKGVVHITLSHKNVGMLVEAMQPVNTFTGIRKFDGVVFEDGDEIWDEMMTVQISVETDPADHMEETR